MTLGPKSTSRTINCTLLTPLGAVSSGDVPGDQPQVSVLPVCHVLAVPSLSPTLDFQGISIIFNY